MRVPKVCFVVSVLLVIVFQGLEIRYLKERMSWVEKSIASQSREINMLTADTVENINKLVRIVESQSERISNVAYQSRSTACVIDPAGSKGRR